MFQIRKNRMSDSCRSVNKDNIEDFLSSFDTFLCDCDGVLWHGFDPMSDAIKFLNRLQEMGKQVILVTNNSARTRKECLDKCKGFGLNVTEDRLYCTTYLAANYVKDLGFDKKVYIVGSSKLAQEFDLMGIQNFGSGPDAPGNDSTPMSTIMKKGVHLEDDVGAVVVGFDFQISYIKFMKAANYLNRPDCHFIATDGDETLPSGNSNLKIPGPGTMVKAVEVCSGRKPFLLGKPSPFMFETIRQQHNIDPARTVMIGDNSRTDIQLGKNCGLKTVMVLTGVTTMEDIDRWKKTPEDHRLLADYLLPSLGDLLPLVS